MINRKTDSLSDIMFKSVFAEHFESSGDSSMSAKDIIDIVRGQMDN